MTTKAGFTLEVLNPVAEFAGDRETYAPAPRPSTLNGARVGLYWNRKPGGDHALNRIGEGIAAQFPGVTYKIYSSPRPVRQEVMDAIREECDVVVGSGGD